MHLNGIILSKLFLQSASVNSVIPIDVQIDTCFFLQNVMKALLVNIALLLVIASTISHVIISLEAVQIIYARLAGRAITAA